MISRSKSSRSEPGNPVLTARLKRLLLLSLLAVLVVATIAAAASAYLQASDTQDETLLSIATLVESSQLDVNLNRVSYDSDDDDIDQSAVRVWELGKKTRHGINMKRNIKVGFHTVFEDDDLWRVYVTSNRRSGKNYVVAQKLSVSAEIALNSAINTAWPLLLLFLAVPILVSFLVRHSFKPLNSLTKKIRESDTVDLELDDQKSIPVEVLPFVSSINTLLAKNKAYNQQQRRFIADAAHELRTPITALSLEIENMNSARTEQVRMERQAGLSGSVMRLQRLVNQLLDLARIQSSDVYKRVPISVNQLVRDQIAELYALIEEKEIELIVSNNESVQVEDVNDQLQHLIRNALSNAIKFTPENGTIDVSLRKQKEYCVFEVIDNGPGVNDDQLRKLSEPFYRPDGQASGKGAGLGLAICQEIAAILKGEIHLDNAEPAGFRFRYKQQLATDI